MIRHLCIFFFVPYGLLVAELGSSVPEEGGAYVWTRMAWGRLTGALNSVFYWFSNPVWIGATLARWGALDGLEPLGLPPLALGVSYGEDAIVRGNRSREKMQPSLDRAYPGQGYPLRRRISRHALPSRDR